MPDLIHRRCFAPSFPLVDALARTVLAELDPAPTPDTPWLDLSTDLFLLPSRGASRALREAFVRHAADHQRGLLPPRIVTPAVFLDAFLPAKSAHLIESTDAWDQVLSNRDPASLQPLFPALGDRLPDASRLTAARMISRLRETLARAGHHLQSAAETFRAAGYPSSARWDLLSNLEAEYIRELTAINRTDPLAPPPDEISLPESYAGIRRIHLCADPEPSPRLVKILSTLANEGIEIVIRIPADPTDTDAFDAWGRPHPSVFSRRVAPLADEVLTTAADPEAFAAAVASEIKSTVPPPATTSDLAIGAADPSIIPIIRGHLQSTAIPAYDPAGIPLSRTGGHAFFRTMIEWLSDGSIGSLHEWLHLPMSGDWLGSSIPSAKLLSSLDRFRIDSVTASIESATPIAPDDLRPILRAATEWHRLAQRAPDFPRRLCQHFLATARKVPQTFDHLFPDGRAAATVLDALYLIAELPPRPRSGLNRLRIALGAIESTPVYPDSRPSGIEILGWREWIWNAHPRLIVTGLAEGVVPESFRGDPFLNETERALLGLPTAATRLERDATIFDLLCSLRNPNRSLRIVHCTNHAPNDPVRPSRLLFKVPDSALPARVRSLFGEIAHLRPRVAPSPPRQFYLPATEPPSHLNVSDLGTWLDCPKRFLLKRIHKMDTLDDFGELSPRHFGTLVHTCLETLNTVGADLADLDSIRRQLHAILDREVETSFGPRPATLPFLQIRALRRRLDRVAEVVAESRREGWRPIHAEWRFGWETTWMIEGLPIRGIVDCIEHHPGSGRYRILDYKTSAQPAKPSEKHFGRFPNHLDSSAFDPSETVPTTGKTSLRWTNLQLPLYALAVQDILGQEVETAYFNIPHDPAETALAPFTEDGPDLRSSALACARHVVRSILDGVFEPARRKPSPGDPFTAIAVDDPDPEFKPIP